MFRNSHKRRLSIWISASLVAAYFSFSPFAQNSAQAWTSPSSSAGVYGGTGAVQVIASVSDSAGNIYTSGVFNATADFDPSAATASITSYGGNDVFISKFDPAGNLLWAKRVGGAYADTNAGIAIDGSNNVAITGTFYDVGYFNPSDTTTGVLSAFSAGYAIYVSKFDSDGNYLWAKSFGYPAGGAVAPTGIAVDPSSGAVYTHGAFGGAIDFDPGASVDTRTNRAAQADGFIQKLDASGNYQWTRVIGNAGNDGTSVVGVDGSGNLIVVGGVANCCGNINIYSSETTAATAVTMDGSLGQSYILKFTSSGSLTWGKSIALGGSELGITSSGDFYIGGNLQGTIFYNTSGIWDLDSGAGVANFSSSNGANMIAKFDSSGGFLWAKQTGGTVTSIAVDSSGIYSAGWFTGSVDFNPDVASETLTATTTRDSYMAKWDLSGNLSWVKRLATTTSAPQTFNVAIVMGQSQTLYISGYYTAGSLGLGPAGCTMNFPIVGGVTSFLLALDSSGNQLPIPSPTFSSLTVPSGLTSGGTSSRFIGTSLYCTTGVTVDGNVASFSIVSDTSVAFTTPVGTSGAKDVVITTPFATVTASAAFLYSQPVSSFSAFSLAGSVTTVKYRSAIVISATVLYASKVTFLYGGKRIAGCISKATALTSPFTVTCTWKPTRKGGAPLTAVAVPNAGGISAGNATPINVGVGLRTTLR